MLVFSLGLGLEAKAFDTGLDALSRTGFDSELSWFCGKPQLGHNIEPCVVTCIVKIANKPTTQVQTVHIQLLN